jgi:hypothetical protein
VDALEERVHVVFLVIEGDDHRQAVRGQVSGNVRRGRWKRRVQGGFGHGGYSAEILVCAPSASDEADCKSDAAAALA